VTEGGGGSDGPPDRPARPDPDEAMYRPASSAGWDDEPTAKPAAAKAAPNAPATSSPVASSPAASSPAASLPAASLPAASLPAASLPAASLPAASSPAASSPAASLPAASLPAAPLPAAPSPAAPSPAAPSPAATAPPSGPPVSPPATARPTTPPGPWPAIRSTSPPPGVSFPVFVPSAKPAATAPTGPATAPSTGATAGDRALPDPGSAARTATHGDAEHDDDDDDADPADEPRPRPSVRTVLLAAVLAIGTAGIVVVVLLGYLNSDRYVLACEPERAVPEQGRGFPPWGTRALTGAAWRPVKIAPETRCQPRETDDALVLQRLFLAMVLDQATALLTAREVNRVDDAEALLQQALLLTRPAELEPEPLARQRGEQHQEIERLLGDVAYWRGQAKVRDALSALGDAAKQFDAAIARHPRHVSDAAAWAARVRTLSGELHAGSAGAASGPGAPSPATPLSPSPATPPSPSPATPPPPSPAPAPPATTGSAGSAAGTAGTAPPAELERSAHPSPPLDAGAPAGGVLL
jgi:hypothetical protein